MIQGTLRSIHTSERYALAFFYINFLLSFVHLFSNGSSIPFHQKIAVVSCVLCVSCKKHLGCPNVTLQCGPSGVYTSVELHYSTHPTIHRIRGGVELTYILDVFVESQIPSSQELKTPNGLSTVIDLEHRNTRTNHCRK